MIISTHYIGINPMKYAARQFGLMIYLMSHYLRVFVRNKNRKTALWEESCFTQRIQNILSNAPRWIIEDTCKHLKYHGHCHLIFAVSSNGSMTIYDWLMITW